VDKKKLDLESLLLDPSRVGALKAPKKRRRQILVPFALKVPQPWMVRAYRAGAGMGAMTGLALWYLSGVRCGTRTVRLTNIAAAAWGVSRQMKWKALDKLAAAGLVSIERQNKASPLVTIIVPPEDEEAL
jgi:hypothetical protein